MNVRNVLVFAIASVALGLPTISMAQSRPDRPVDATVRPRRPPPPALLIKGPDGKHKPIELRKVSADVRVLGHIAQTSLTMTFFNPHGRALEGDLYVPLPEGSTVSGYALDVNGTLVDGVVVTKDKARQVFEAEVRKGVDPGLVEWTAGNNFKTRVFPLPPKGTRTIRISWVSDLIHTKDGTRFELPMNFREKVGEIHVRVEVVKSPAAPLKLTGGPKGLTFEKGSRESYIAESKVTNAKVTHDLVVDLPKMDRAPVRVERAPDGHTYFSIVDAQVSAPDTTHLKPKRLGIYWDASMSRAATDRKAEMALLERYLSQLDPGTKVDLVLVRNDFEGAGTYELPRDDDKLLKRIGRVVYDGATQLGTLGRDKGASKRDMNLLFTDGVSNFGEAMTATLSAPTWVINSSSTANHPLMRHLATESGGAYLNLNRVDVATASATIGRATHQLLEVKVDSGEVADVFPKNRRLALADMTVAGRIVSDEARLTLVYGAGGRATSSRTFVVTKTAPAQGQMLRRYWAQKQIEDLVVFPDRNADALIRIGKRYGIVTPGTSLLVLETLQQYIQHRVRPPASLAEFRKKYDAAVEQLASKVKIAKRSKLDRIVKLWTARKSWWDTEFKYPKNYRYKDRRAKKSSRAPNAAARPARATGAVREESAAPSAAGEKAANATPGNREPGVAMKRWDPQTPYLKAIKAAPKAERYTTYLKQRAVYGSAPSFFLDSSDYFRQQKENVLARRILTNIAELELENAALLRVLAHRLAQLDALDDAIVLFRRAKQLRPEEPQSYRDLALVLARRASTTRKAIDRRDDYREALELLGRVVMDRWSRFDEIEVIALTELNNIWPKAKKAGVKTHGLDPRLIAQLDMDIRIVMSWDADLTDMDLHVVEPSGEKAYYGHNRTKIGGLVSRDFTRGYGPEVYALRRAMKGTYTIKTKFFGSSAAKLTGAVTLQVDVFTNFGRTNEKRRSVTLRLTEKKESFVVAEIEF